MALRIGDVQVHANEHDFRWIANSFQNLVQPAVDQTLVEIKHGLDGRLRLLQHNHMVRLSELDELEATQGGGG